VLADDTNASLDIIDSSSDRWVGQVAGFAGGPNGVITDGAGYVWAGDGDNTVKVVDLGPRCRASGAIVTRSRSVLV
jgi:hypothetical protein